MVNQLRIEDINREELADALTNAIMRLVEKDEHGDLWFVDKDGNKLMQITGESDKEKPTEGRQSIKEASQLSLQKKENRMVINLPEWLKDKLKERAKRTGVSMNEIIRNALAEYLSKEKA